MKICGLKNDSVGGFRVNKNDQVKEAYEEMRGDMNQCVGYNKFSMAFKSIQVRGDKRRYRKW